MKGPAVPDAVLFLVPSFIWGTTWLTIKFQLGAVAPEASVVYRFSLAALVLFGWCAIRRVPLRFDGRTHAAFMLLGLFQYAINYVLVYQSEVHLTSGLLAVVFVLMAVWNLVGARIFFGNPIHLTVAAGASLGMVGVALVFWPDVARMRGESGQTVGLVLGVAATFASSAGNLWSQRVYARGIAIAPSTAFAMMYGAIQVALYCAALRIPFAIEPRFSYFASLAYLAVFGSVIAFITFLTFLRRVGAGRAGYSAVVIPVLAMATSTVFEGYRWSALALLGMALVLAGNVMVLRPRAG